ncbi:MAG: GNAT family N-acetyltransferase [Lysobacteraceae bacterium]
MANDIKAGEIGADKIGAGKIRIESWHPRWANAFRDLNLEWLERYFVVEPVDREVLDNPQRLIIDAGGEILFAVDGEDRVLGTCALLRINDDEVELTKMGVTAASQGAGIGRRLIVAAIERFRQMPGDTLFLETNSVLTPALALYRSVGFELQDGIRPGSHYDRADTYMIWRGPEAA